MTSSGFALYKILIISVFIHTDLPEPVAPAIRRCGILAISVIMILPPISFPTANVTGDFDLVNSSLSSSSLKPTEPGSGFGTSMPTADLPGIGASILMLCAARLNLRSSARFVILLTLTPCSGNNSYLVTVGPHVTAPICTFTLKLLRVSWSLAAVLRKSSSVMPLEDSSGILSSPGYGKIYSGSGSPASSLLLLSALNVPEAET